MGEPLSVGDGNGVGDGEGWSGIISNQEDGSFTAVLICATDRVLDSPSGENA